MTDEASIDLQRLGQAADIAEAAARLEAAGYTVTPPDPLAADREFLAGLCEALGQYTAGEGYRGGLADHRIPAAMDYLRQNKGRL